MNNTKFTQGAWEVMAGELQDMVAISAESDDLNNGYVIATAHGADRVANARLIAAAPDLLETLRAVADEIEDQLDHLTRLGETATSDGRLVPVYGGRYLADMRAALTRVRVSIAKAEGQS